MKNKNLACQNNLLQARRRSSLSPKQASVLIAKKGTDELHRYERGSCFPTLPTLLKLEIIYRMPVRLLFQDLFETLRTEINEKRKAQPALFPESAWFPSRLEQLGQEEECFYAGILKTRFPSPAEIEIINAHVIAVNNTLIEYKQGFDPRSIRSPQ